MDGHKRKAVEKEELAKKRARESSPAHGSAEEQGAPGEPKSREGNAEQGVGREPSAAPSDHASPALQERYPSGALLPSLEALHGLEELGALDPLHAAAGGVEEEDEEAGGGDALLAVRQDDAMDEDVPAAAAAEAAAVAAGPAPSQQQSVLEPQCAVIVGSRPPEEPEVSTCQVQGAAEGEAVLVEGAGQPAAQEPSRQYLAAKEEIQWAVVRPGEQAQQQLLLQQQEQQRGEGQAAGAPERPTAAVAPLLPAISWDHFPNYLGEGVKSRLMALASLHLLRTGRFPAAVTEMASNSNKVLLGAAANCELYQERVVRALAQKLQVPLLVVDAATLRLDSDEAKEGGATDDMFDRPTYPGDPFDLSDEDDPYGGGEKKDRQDPLLDTTLSRRFSGRRPLGFAVIQPHLQPPGQAADGAAAQQAKQQQREREQQQKPGGAAKAGADAKAAECGAGAEENADKAADWSALHEAVSAVTAKAVAALGGMEGAGQNPGPAAAAAGKAPAAPGEDAKPAPAEEGKPPVAPAASATPPAAPQPQQPAGADAPGPSAPRPAVGPGLRAALEKFSKEVAAAAAAERRPQPSTVSAAVSAVAGSTPGGAAAGDGKPAVAVGVPAPGGASKPAPGAAAAAAVALKRNARVSYIGRVHPSVLASQERLEAIQSAISRLESQGTQTRSIREYLPALILRQRMAAAGGGKAGPASRMQAPGAPPIGSLGRVVSLAGDRVEVAMDEPFPGGATLQGGKEKCGFTCSALELQQVEDKEDPWVSSFRALFDIIKEECERGPLIVMIQSMDRLIRSQAADHFRKLEALLAGLPQRCLVFACYCSRTLAREKAGGSGGPGGGMFPSRLGLDMLPGYDEMTGWLDRLGRGGGSKAQRKSSKGKLLARMFPNAVELHAPNQEAHAKEWRKMVEADVATMRERANRTALRKALAKCGIECDDLAAVCITESQLSKREVEQVVGVAVAEQLAVEEEGVLAPAAQPTQGQPPQQQGTQQAAGAAAAEGEPKAKVQQAEQAQQGGEEAMVVDGASQSWVLKAKYATMAADAVRKLQQEAAAQPERKALQDISADQYERQLLTEVIPPEEINVKFEDIGALEGVKNTLHEVVILPLQRPELFTRGSLTKPTKGLLLFGPPGTGKTMLAKAVASESGAHFINVNMSAITSKWFGEGERLVRALFSLAHKLSPAVIFIDEIDSFLSKRGQSNNEHEALRKMKNEFMQHWDGLRTKLNDRVLVLAATNRPMDLDDAVIRRMPRRIFVPLPDAANRAKILKVILKDEAIEEGFSVEEVASWTDGYSGSDLKNLCIAAAYFPIRQYLEEEKARKAGEAPGETTGAAPPGGGSGGTTAGGGGAHVVPVAPKMRWIRMGDFKEAMKQVTSSVSSEAVSMSELKRWNDQYGEGGSRRAEALHYFT